MGGSLANTGGHNPLEAAALGKPLLMGPFCFNFTQVFDQLEQVQALRITTSGRLLDDISELLSHASLRQSMGVAGADLVVAQKGALKRHLIFIAATLEQALNE